MVCLLKLFSQPLEQAVNFFVEEISPLLELLLFILGLVCLVAARAVVGVCGRKLEVLYNLQTRILIVHVVLIQVLHFNLVE